MIRSFLTVSTGTLASRLLGFLRDAMIAALLGTGPVADAFLVAFQMINVVRRLLTEGALNAALVPAWLRLRETQGATAAAAFAGQVLATVSATLLALSVLVGLLMPLVLTALAPGFAGEATLHFAVADSRLMLPYLAFAGPSTVLLALYSAQSRFALTAFSPLLFNIALIAVMIALAPARPEAAFVARALAATVGIAGFLQLLILFSRRSGAIASPLRVSFAADMRGFFARAIPGMVANAAPQLLIVGGAMIASSSPSAVSWLYFANRLVELPLGIVGVATGTVLVSELARAHRGGDAAAVAQAQSHALELGTGLALPATLGLAVLSEPIVRLLFEHGAFTGDDTRATAQALARFARPCADQGALAILFRTRGHLGPAQSEPDWSRRCGRRRVPARITVRRKRHRRRHRGWRLGEYGCADPERHGCLRLRAGPCHARPASPHCPGRIPDGRPAPSGDPPPCAARPRPRPRADPGADASDRRRGRHLPPSARLARRRQLAAGG